MATSDTTYLVALSSLKSAERNGGGRAYLARLTAGPRGDVQRLFVRASKTSKNRRALTSAARPGDVFEARRWLWDGNRQQYFGGTIWFGVQGDGSLCMLTRDEALRAIGAVALPAGGRPEVPDHRRATRMVPDDLAIVPISDVRRDERAIAPR